MSKRITFHLGFAVGLSGRLLTITRMARAGDVVPITPEIVDHIGGSTESVTLTLSDNTIYQATLVDTKTTGEVSRKAVLGFHTGSLQFPGPKSDDRLQILSMEDMSSSSSSSASSISTSSSSVSSQSTSSISTSSSSISTSSNSSSSSASSQSSSSSSSSST